MKITKFKKTSKGKYKVYLSDNTSIYLYEDVIINNNLLFNKEITKEKLKSIEKENNDFDLYNTSLKYISIRLRSKKEVEDYLLKKGYSKTIIDTVIKRLLKEGYINDFKFSKAYVNDKLALTTNGPNKIRNNLIKLGVEKDVINEVIDEIDQKVVEEKLYNLIEKKIKYQSASSKMLKIKFLNYFYNEGYDKYLILSTLSKFNIKSDINSLQKEYDKLYKKYKDKYDKEELKLFITNKLYSKGYSTDDINKIKTED